MSKARKKSQPEKKHKADSGAGADFLKQMGIEIPNFDGENFGLGGADDDGDLDDNDLLNELAALDGNSGGARSKRSKPPPKKAGAAPQNLQAFHQDVSKLLKDIDGPVNDDELSGDDDELLAELKEMTGVDDEPVEEERQPIVTRPVAQPATASNTIVTTLEQRLAMYKQAMQAAKAKGDAAKSRRYERQHNAIQELLRDARAGKPINESDIPPEIGSTAAPAPQPQVDEGQISVQMSSTASQRPLPVQPPSTSLPKNEASTTSEPTVSKSNDNDHEIARLTALITQALRQNDKETATKYLIQKKDLQSATATESAPSVPTPAPTLPAAENPAPDEQTDEAPAVPLVAPVPRTIMESLVQRRDEFTKRHKEATSKGEGSKARRLDRVVKQYEEAINATRRGLQFNYKELPDPPGFAPIPLEQATSESKSAPTPAPVPAPAQPHSLPGSNAPPQQRPKPAPNTPAQQHSSSTAATAAPIKRNEKQIQALRLRQQQFNDLMMQAKQNDDRDTAIRHLISFKKVRKMLEDAESGLSVNMNELPELPPDDFDVVLDDELTQQIAQSDRETVYRRLQEDLLRQMQLCVRNQQIYAQMTGETNVKLARDFKSLEQRCAQDLERLKQSYQNGCKTPAFHYEKRQMNIIQVNNDLVDNDCEVTVLRGINLHVPVGYTSSAFQTYVIIEFPLPLDACQSGRTRLATGSVNAEYDDHAHKFQLKRNDKKLPRLLERKELKLTIYYKAGFLRSDKQLGVAFVKLEPLLKTSMIHESVNVYENEHRKKAEGKLEVKIRIKEAIGAVKSSELISQVWLVIDHFDKSTSDAKVSAQSQASADKSNDDTRPNSQSAIPQSIQVLTFEAESLHERIEQLEDVLSPDQIELFRVKHKELEEQKNRLVENLRQGGKEVIDEYVRNLEQLLERYKREEEEYRQQNDTKKADLALNKKNLVAKEIETLDVVQTTDF